MLYLTHQLPELRQFTPLERRILLLNFGFTRHAADPSRSRYTGYAIFLGQIGGIIVGSFVVPNPSEHTVFFGMFGGLFMSFVAIYFIGISIDRSALRSFIAASLRPIVPLNDRVAVIAHHGYPPKA
jgi:hypothetical protein